MKLTHEQVTALRKATAVLSGTGHHDEASEINRMLAHPDHSGDRGECCRGLAPESECRAECKLARIKELTQDNAQLQSALEQSEAKWIEVQSPVPQDGDSKTRFHRWYRDQWPLSAHEVELGRASEEVQGAYDLAKETWQAALASNKAASETKVQKGSWVNEPPVMPWEGRSYSEDEKAAIRFYVENPSAALLDFGKRVSSNKAAAVAVGEPRALSDDERIGTYRHLKTRGIYDLIAFALLESDKAEMAVYRSWFTGDVWLRPVAEFFDGRFERLGGAPAPIASAEEAVPVGWTTQFDLANVERGETGVIFKQQESGDVALYTHSAAAQPGDLT